VAALLTYYGVFSVHIAAVIALSGVLLAFWKEQSDQTIIVRIGLVFMAA
jgi:hypothetical protein